MTKFLQGLLILAITVFTTSAMAFTPPPSPKPAGNIADQAGMLTPQSLGKLNSQLRQINANSANEIGVLIIKSLNGEDIRDVGYATFKAWGVGKRDVDNGVLIVWAPGDRKIGIETGKGVEGDLPDLKCNDIIRNVMGPEFKQQHYEAGLSHAFVAINQAIVDHRADVAARDRRNAASPVPPSTATAMANGPTTTVRTDSHGSNNASCDITGSVAQASTASGIVYLLILGGLTWLGVSRWRAKNKREQAESGEKRRKLEARQQLLDRQELEHQREAELSARLQEHMAQATAAKVAKPVIIPAAIPVHEPIATATATTATVDIAARIRQQQEEEARQRQMDAERKAREAEGRRQARLQRLEEERRQREREEEEAALAAAALAAAAAAAISYSSDDDNSGSSGGSSGSYESGSSSDDGGGCAADSGGSDPDPDFGGGDTGGGGSSDSY